MITLHERSKNREKLIPAIIILQNNKSESISIDKLEIKKQLQQNGFRAKIFQIGKYKCIARDIQFHPVSEEVIHIDFLEISHNPIVRVRVPIKFINIELSEELKFGSKLNKQFRDIYIQVHADSIPEKFEIDIGQNKFRFGVDDIKDFHKYEIKNILNIRSGQSIATIQRSRNAKNIIDAEETAA